MTKMWFYAGLVCLWSSVCVFAGEGGDLDERDTLFSKPPSSPLSPLRPGEMGAPTDISLEEDDCMSKGCVWCCFEVGILQLLECCGCITFTTRDGTALAAK